MRENNNQGSPAAVSIPHREQDLQGSPAAVRRPQGEQNNLESPAAFSRAQGEQDLQTSPAAVSRPLGEDNNQASPAAVSRPQEEQNNQGSPAEVSSPQGEQNHKASPAAARRPLVEENPQASPAAVRRPLVEENPQASPAAVSRPQGKQNNQKSPAAVSRPLVEENPQASPAAVSRPLVEENPQASPAAVSRPQGKQNNQESPAAASRPQVEQNNWGSPAADSSPQVDQNNPASPAAVSTPHQEKSHGVSPAAVSRYQGEENPQRSPLVVISSQQNPQGLPAAVSSSQLEKDGRASYCSPGLVGCSPAVVIYSQVEQIEVLESVDAVPVATSECDSSGYISSGQFWTLLQKHGSELDPHKLDVLLALAQSNTEGKICYQDVLNLMGNKRSNSFRRAILQGNRHLCNRTLLEESSLDLTQRLIRHVAYETLPREIDRKWFYDNYTGCPPPWFMITVTIVEVAIFVYYGLLLDRFVLQVMHSRYLKQNPLVYHPQLRAQAWRYLSYMFMHAGIEHLGVNIVLQLLVGVPLEMVHGTLRVGFVYVAGVVAGSLAVSVADMTAPVVGSSGGVYAIVSAHLANIVMNWSGMRCQFKLLRMSFALICMSLEFGRAVWLRFYPSSYAPCPHPSFVAHLGGVVVGITLGVVVLRNFEQRLQDQWLWWIFLSSFILFGIFAVLWNVFAFSMAGLRLPPPP